MGLRPSADLQRTCPELRPGPAGCRTRGWHQGLGNTEQPGEAGKPALAGPVYQAASCLFSPSMLPPCMLGLGDGICP